MKAKKPKSSNPITGRWRIVSMSAWEDDYLDEEGQAFMITDIKVGQRHRRNMGDLTDLAESIRQEGLLQPLGVTDKLELVFVERRIRAVRDILKKKTVLARIVDVSNIIAGEYYAGTKLLSPAWATLVSYN